MGHHYSIDINPRSMPYYLCYRSFIC